MSEISKRAGAGVGVASDLQRFESVIIDQLENVGLPSDSVFVAVSERQKMLANVSGALEALSEEQRERSHYISKMIAAAAVGLFDAALNYLWDETVSQLRSRVAGFDLSYFFDVAVKNSDLRKHLRSEDDLRRVDDASLLQGAREIGLLTEIGYQRLDHIRYMRNHASTAHPNQIDLTGLDLAGWLEQCVIQVITLPPDTITANTKKLLGNIRTAVLTKTEVLNAAAFFDELPADRADTLADGLFGQYVDPARTPTIADNVRLLWPELWEYVSDDRRGGYGVRYGRYLASADTDQAAAARELIELVDGVAYLPEATRSVEIDAVLDELKAAHLGMDNSYTEVAPARRLAALVGTTGEVPAAVRRKYVMLVVRLFFGNGYGISFSAEPYYRQMLESLDAASASFAIRAFLDETISNLLWNTKPRAQWEKLLDILSPKMISKRDRELYEAIRSFSGDPDKLRLDTKIKKLASRKQV